MSQISFPLHTVKWVQVLLYDGHYLTSVICLHTVCCIWLIDKTLYHSGPESNVNEGLLRISQNSKAGTSPSDCLMSYPGHSLGIWSYLPAESQSVYSTAPAEWADTRIIK